MTEPGRLARGGAVGLVLAATLVPFALLVWRFDFVCDDAFISYRYAHNLIRDHGLCFNPGAEPPVEGYSELLWVLVVALGMTLGVAPWILSKVLSVSAGIALVSLAGVAMSRAAGGRWAPALGAGLYLGTLVPLAVWSTGGMGTTAFVLAAFGLHLALFGGRPRPFPAAFAAVLCVLLRADGAYWVAVSGTTGLVLGRRSPALRRAALLASAGAAVVFLSHVAWRLSVYGDWLPNTARVKVGLSSYTFTRGASYLLHFLATFPGVAVATLLGLWFGRRDRATVLALLASLLYPVLVGGDFMAFGRFVLPALPLSALLLARALAALPPGGALALAGSIAAVDLLPAADLHAVPEPVRSALDVRHNAPEFRSEYEQWRGMKENVVRWTLVGRGLRLYTRPDATVVTGGIGAIGFFSDRFLYDQNGLVTREVALGPPAEEKRSPGHDKAVPPEHFLDRSPTFLRVILHPEEEPLPPEVVPRGPSRDLVRPLEPRHGFPPGYLLIGLRPR